jgi:hypothetical protein
VDFRPDVQFQYRKDITRFFKERMGQMFAVVVPFGHSAETEIEDDTSARGEKPKAYAHLLVCSED